jgi:hypothetical protein
MAIVWLWEKVKKSTVSQRTSLVLASLFLLTACFNAWKAEYDKTRTSLKVYIDMVGIVPHYPGPPPDSAYAILAASVSNIGTPSAADGWLLHVKVLGEKAERVYAPWMFQKGRPIIFDGMNNVPLSYTYGPEEALYLKTAPHPLPTGEKVTGLIGFKLEGLDYERARMLGNVFTIECKDIFGNSVSGTYIRTTHGEGPMRYLPGMGEPDVRSVPLGRQN